MNGKKIFLLFLAIIVAGVLLASSTWRQWNDNQKTLLERTGPILPIAEFNHGAMVDDVEFSPSNQDIIASVGDDNNIKIWNTNNPSTLTKTLHDNEETLVSLDFLNNGELLLCKGLHRKMILCDASSWERIILPQEQYCWDAEISPSADYLANVYSQRLELWDIRNPNEITEITEITEIHHTKYANSMRCADFSPNGKWLAIGFENGDIKFWDLEQKQFIKTLSVPHESHEHLKDIIFSPDGRWIAAAEHSSLSLWDVQQSRRVKLLEDTYIGFLRDVKFSPDGRYIGIKTQDKMNRYTIWSLPEVQIYHEGSGRYVTDLAFSPDGKILAISDAGEVTLLSIENLTPIALLQGKGFLGGAMELSFSQDGSMLAGGGYGGVLRLWDIGKLNER
ncbi:MAG: WD40 repeat domain-containing protein [Candidatus Poribacteria bacterium]|nr:WD40 repeat domain-containing protein [Candidatus Poribacteria bacterium]